ncbi:MAG: gamma-glutamyltransferase [Longimicrobiales bacterium]|nr:gamma-glutamyltransferase [Longimicrobiales bacterium]
MADATRTFAWGLLLIVAGCTAAPESSGGGPFVADFAATATSEAGMVVSGSPYATEAGVRMLEAGGNAVDAAVAAAFALAVAEPTQSGLGGRTQMLVRMADGTLSGIDGTTQVPAAYDSATAPEGEHGHAAVGIPGTVAALTRALERHGTLPLATVLGPARGFARDGIALPAGEAGRLSELAGEVDPASEAARIFYAPGVVPLAPGATLVQPDLADVLDTLAARGPDAFYRGSISRRIAEDMAAHGGYVTAQDLATYQAEDSEVGEGAFAGARVLGSYLPASGVAVVEILQILDRVAPDPADEGTWASALTEALLAGFEDREVTEAEMDPAAAVAWLTSDSLADRRAAQIANKLRAVAATAESPMAGVPALAFDDGSEPAFTTHISVADTFGNAVALSQSLGPTLGSRVVTPGLGFLYASTLGGYLTGGEPGYRPWSSQAPLIVVTPSAMLVIGGAGSRRILSALVSTLTRYVRDGEGLEAALAAPRLHPTGDRVDVQEAWPAAAALEALGYQVTLREPSYFARLNAVELLAPRSFRGVGEPRWAESAAGGPRR